MYILMLVEYSAVIIKECMDIHGKVYESVLSVVFIYFPKTGECG